jgi:hypothetical protein
MVGLLESHVNKSINDSRYGKPILYHDRISHPCRGTRNTSCNHLPRHHPHCHFPHEILRQKPSKCPSFPYLVADNDSTLVHCRHHTRILRCRTETSLDQSTPRHWSCHIRPHLGTSILGMPFSKGRKEETFPYPTQGHVTPLARA